MAFMDSFFNNAQVIFGGFHKPEVLKSNDDGLQRQISYLEAHLTEENKRKLAGLKKGLEGEQNVLFQLKNSGIGMYILHGIHVGDMDGDDAQIDFVVVTRGWTYLIECKKLEWELEDSQRRHSPYQKWEEDYQSRVAYCSKPKAYGYSEATLASEKR